MSILGTNILQLLKPFLFLFYSTLFLIEFLEPILDIVLLFLSSNLDTQCTGSRSTINKSRGLLEDLPCIQACFCMVFQPHGAQMVFH